MKKVKIIIDSTADLTPEYIKENDIEVMPLKVIFNSESYSDGVDIDVETLYKRVKENKSLPKTAAISTAEFITTFSKYIEQGYEIFFTGISSKMSSTYSNAVIAGQTFEEGKVVVYDSYNLSTGIGLQVLKAVKLRNEGKSAQEIKDYLLGITLKVRSQFLIETLDYLYKGGRCSALTYFFGRGFHIKPIIRVQDGTMVVFKKPIGKTLNACNALLDIIKKDLDNIDLDCVMITSSIAPQSEKYLYDELSKIIDPKIIMITHAGCVISSHCGPGTIGILYIVK